MSYLEPLAPIGQLSPVPIPGLTPQTQSPIIQNLPSTLSSFQRKYSNSDTIAALKRVPKNVRRSIIQMDHDRAMKGQFPLSTTQTANAMITATRHKPTTKKEEGSPWNPLNFLGNAREDLQSIVTEIPKVPLTFAKEASDLIHIDEKLKDVKQVGDIASLPGVRLIPGAFTVGGVLPGGTPAGELIEHPLFTALDVLPYAQKFGGAALRTEAGQAARTATAESRIGRAVSAQAEQLRTSAPGQWVREAFGPVARGQSRMKNIEDLRLGEEINPTTEIRGPFHTKTVPNPRPAQTRAGELVRESQTYGRDLGIPLERQTELTTQAARGDLSGITDPVELQFIGRTRDITEGLARETQTLLPPEKAMQKLGARGERVPVEGEGEWYDAGTAAKLYRQNAKTEANKAMAAVHRQMATPLEGAEIQAFGPEIRKTLAREDISPTQTARLAEGMADNLDAAGVEAGHLFDAVKAFRKKEIDQPTLIQAFEETTANPTMRVTEPLPPDRSMVQPAAEGVPPVFHGTSREFATDVPGYAGGNVADNLVGPGFYTTADESVAKSYMSKRRGTGTGSEEAKAVYNVKWTGKGKPKILDLDDVEAITPALRDRMTTWVDRGLRNVDITDEGFNRVMRAAAEGTGRDFYAAVRGALGETGDVSRVVADDIVMAMTEHVFDGIDAFKHQGGVATNSAIKHDVYVWLDPEKMKLVKLPESEGVRPAVMTKEELLASLPDTKTDPYIVRLRDSIANDRFKDAAKIAKALNKRAKHAIPDLESAIDNLTRKARQQRFIERTGQAEKAAARSEAKLQKAIAQNPPARYMQPLTEEVQRRLAVRLSEGTPENIDAITRQVVARDFDNLPGYNKIEAAQLAKEVKPTWLELKAAGVDPVFVHSYDPQALNSLEYPSISSPISTPSSVKKRTNDFSPIPGSASVAMSHQGLELLAARGTQNYGDALLDWQGATRAELDARYRPAAEARAKGVAEMVPHELKRLRAREWGKFDPSEYGMIRSDVMKAKFGDEEIFLPKSVLKNLGRQMSVVQSPIGGLLDIPMAAFRTAVLPLSPRWQFYNLLGGAGVMALSNPTAFLKLRQARKAIKEGYTDPIFSEGHTLRMSAQQRLNMEWSNAAAKTAGRWMDEANVARQAGQVLSPVRQFLGKIPKWSYDRNSWVDEMFKTADYIDVAQRAMKKGATKAEAQLLAEQSVRKLLQDWTEITPLERSVMRYMVPFYGFMQHIMRYTFRYPIEHPFRTAVLGAFARAEEEDFGTGLPQRFLNGFFLGSPDENGNVTQINLDGLNPFRDVANNFTLAGIAGQLNPVVQTGLQQLGVDTRSGGPELFPTLRYDAMSGQLKAQTDNPITSFLSNTIPQVELLKSLAGASSEFKELARSNPDAARRMLQSQAGLPVLTKTVNVPQEEIKSELRLEADQQKVLSDALKSGDYTEAQRYPALKPFLSQIQTLSNQGKLKKFQPNAPVPSGVDAARQLVPIG